MFKLTFPAYCSLSSATLFSQNMFGCRNRFVLLIFSLLCTIIVLTQQAVALTIPTSQRASGSSPSFSTASFSSSESLVMILPQVNASEGKMLSVLEQETSFNNNNDNMAVLVDVLTPGQQVINAVPDKERGDFIMYELAIALKESKEVEELSKGRWLKNLEDVEEFYGKKLTKLENVPIYENFPQDLLQWIEQKFNLTHQNVYNQLRSRSQLLCTSDGVCYNSKNIGCYCCPF
ncbi:hypothetical protein FF38_00522 [Lucilia cuprina]|uniref:Uncharacterized protein n=1 Tax=Lucilia cuprina TaxID=7375 RepID=A0A0L0CQT7_LUCCU|nr:hypothetical protein FF38_00522 [Lucilia cuprina]